jgi:hypothetical protein
VRENPSILDHHLEAEVLVHPCQIFAAVPLQHTFLLSSITLLTRTSDIKNEILLQ